MSFEDRQGYNEFYKTWNPSEFDADSWMNLCEDAGLKMFAFTTNRHEGFSMFDTKTRVRNRTNWIAPGGPKMEECDLAYGILETPFRRDVVKEPTSAAHRRKIKIDLYFSHPDWYDANFRPYGWHPLQVPSSPKLWGWTESDGTVEGILAECQKANGQSPGDRARPCANRGTAHGGAPQHPTHRTAHSLRNDRYDVPGYFLGTCRVAGDAGTST